MRALSLSLLVLVLLQACAPAQTPFSVTFVPHWDGTPLHCDTDDRQLSDLRFFVSELQLIDSSGSVAQATLVVDQEWQNGVVAMIDLENGEGACTNGTPDTHAVIRATVAKGSYEQLRFTVGVPFDQNHANPLTADAPLDDAAMHWHWRSGYKFLRAGFTSPEAEFWIHLGSTGCEGTVQNISTCASPNRVGVEIPLSSVQDLTIGIDLARLFADTVGSNCSSGPAESACKQPFNALGLGHQQPAEGSQKVFAQLP